MSLIQVTKEEEIKLLELMSQSLSDLVIEAIEHTGVHFVLQKSGNSSTKHWSRYNWRVCVREGSGDDCRAVECTYGSLHKSETFLRGFILGYGVGQDIKNKVAMKVRWSPEEIEIIKKNSTEIPIIGATISSEVSLLCATLLYGHRKEDVDRRLRNEIKRIQTRKGRK